MICVFLVAQLCLTLCDPLDYSPPGSSVHGIFQARILELEAIFFPLIHEHNCPVKLGARERIFKQCIFYTTDGNEQTIQMTVISITVGKNSLKEME